MMTPDEVVSLIAQKYPNLYPPQGLEVLKAGINSATPLIKQSLEKYLKEGIHDQISILDYTVDKLMNDHGQNAIAAYLTLDALIQHPDMTLKVLHKGNELFTAHTT
jgi:hypothetical protein